MVYFEDKQSLGEQIHHNNVLAWGYACEPTPYRGLFFQLSLHGS